MPNADKELLDHGGDDEAARAYFERIKDKPFEITDPSVPVAPPESVPVDKVDRHRRYQAFAMFGCKRLWKEEYARWSRADVIGELQGRVREHPGVPRVMETLKNQLEVETALGELPAVGALNDAVAFFIDRKAKIGKEAEGRDKAKAVVKRHQQEIARHELAMSAYAESAVEAGVLKPFNAYQAGDYVLVVLGNQEGGYSVSMMPLQKS